MTLPPGNVFVVAAGATLYGFGLASLAGYAVDKEGGIAVLACLLVMFLGAAMAYIGVVA